MATKRKLKYAIPKNIRIFIPRLAPNCGLRKKFLNSNWMSLRYIFLDLIYKSKNKENVTEILFH